MDSQYKLTRQKMLYLQSRKIFILRSTPFAKKAISHLLMLLKIQKMLVKRLSSTIVQGKALYVDFILFTGAIDWD